MKPTNPAVFGFVLFAGFVAAQSAARAETGLASIYTYEGGRRTANGEHCNPAGFTAAHRTLPFGTIVQVINWRTARSVFVRVNDRGPFVKGRIIDLTPAGARALGFGNSAGLAPVTVTVTNQPHS